MQGKYLVICALSYNSSHNSPCICEIKRDRIEEANSSDNASDGASTSGTIRYDIRAQADFILHLTADGRMSTST
jgi:hypothetical protein